jgi:hypothetical protein
MCTAMAVIGLVGSLASTAANYAAQSSLQKRQESENQRWAQQQTQKRQAEAARQEEQRKQAEVSRLGAVEDMAPEEQKEAQSAEAARLNTEMQSPESLTTSGDQLLSGETSVGKEVAQDIGARVTAATQQARKRIAALAQVQSYGNSFGGLANRNQEILGQSAQGIDMANNLRKGSLGAFGVENQVSPVRYEASPQAGLIGGLANSIAGAAGGFAGSASGYSAARADLANPSYFPTSYQRTY